MSKGIVLLENGFQEAELIYPYYRMQEAGYEVDLVSNEEGEVYEGEYGYKFRSDEAAEKVDPSEYEFLIIPGGRGPDRMRIKEDIVALVKNAVKNDLVIGAICHGAQILIEADVVKGKRATCWKSVGTDLENAGANYVDEEVVVDGNLVTSRMPPDLPAFTREILKLLE
ncbi:MAG: type 1 glutamine amidotransferase domain-containing protein [Thermoplasmatota archaeon]